MRSWVSFTWVLWPPVQWESVVCLCGRSRLTHGGGGAEIRGWRHRYLDGSPWNASRGRERWNLQRWRGSPKGIGFSNLGSTAGPSAWQVPRPHFSTDGVWTRYRRSGCTALSVALTKGKHFLYSFLDRLERDYYHCQVYIAVSASIRDRNIKD